MDPLLKEATVSAIQLLQQFKHNPHRVLGLHDVNGERKIVRLWRPGARTVHLEVFGKIVEAHQVHEEGIFEYSVPSRTTLLDYQVFHHNGLLAYDPYAFWPTLGEVDSYLFAKGVHYQLYEVLGAKIVVHQGVAGTKFAVWAPAAQEVALVSDFNYWDGRVSPMRNMGSSGIWELFVPGIEEGEKYKFEIRTQQGELRTKSDPFAFMTEVRPRTASVVCNIDRFKWSDEAWIRMREKALHEPKPMNIYEVHLGSWKRKAGQFLNYRELAHELAAYCKEMAFTHVELLPITEHPLDESWGYQVTGFFAVTSRYGSPSDFQYFVNHMHQEGIGIIMDWVPAHFPTDDFSLTRYDGTALFEHEDPRKGFHPHWFTSIFNYGRLEVSNFLLTSALFWMAKMHIDGIRVDAVASMLYLDYGRNEGEWIPNPHGERENLEAIEFIKHLNSIVHQRHPGVLVIAEESTSFTGVTHSVQQGGLGFDFKWNMGWMNDTLRYFHKDPIFRTYHQSDLTFGLMYAFSERFILALSHDEVVHGKASLLSKMPGDDWQKFANMRLLYGYMICHPGKKLLFMGGEIGQWHEWNCKDELQWYLLKYEQHQGLQRCIKELNHFYSATPALWEIDGEWRSFEWIDFSDKKNSVISYLRKGKDSYLACVHNFTPTYFGEYLVSLSNIRRIREVFSTDREEYGGSGKINSHPYLVQNPLGKTKGFKIQLAPLASMIFEVEFASDTP